LVLAACVASGTQCDDFCTLYTSTCWSINNIYNTMASCLHECQYWHADPACAGQGINATTCVSGNSFECRGYHLTVASSSPTNAAIHCYHASPVGDDVRHSVAGPCTDAANATTNWIQSGVANDLCNTLVKNCQGYGTINDYATCMSSMVWGIGSSDFTTLPVSWAPHYTSPGNNYGYTDNSTDYPYPVAAPTGAGTNSAFCKRYHADAAAGDAVTHCPHATAGAGVCGDNCDFFCNLAQGACTGSNQQWTTKSDCMADCATFPAGTTLLNQATGNTYGCRLYHAGVASQSAAQAVVHCPHISKASVKNVCAASSAAGLTANLFLVTALVGLVLFR